MREKEIQLIAELNKIAIDIGMTTKEATKTLVAGKKTGTTTSAIDEKIMALVKKPLEGEDNEL